MVSSHRLFPVVIILHQRKSGFDFWVFGLGCGRSLRYVIKNIGDFDLKRMSQEEIVEYFNVKTKNGKKVGSKLPIFCNILKDYLLVYYVITLMKKLYGEL